MVNATVPLTLLTITDEIAEAAALVAEADAIGRAGNVTKRTVAASGTFWMGSIARKGTVPWGDDPGYKVFRNVLDYGAVGDGITVSLIIMILISRFTHDTWSEPITWLMLDTPY
jgi:hypothetical protein